MGINMDVVSKLVLFMLPLLMSMDINMDIVSK